MTELRDILSSEAVRGAKAFFDQPQGSLLPPEQALPRSPGELYTRFHDHLYVAYRAGLRGKELIKASLSSALGEVVASRRREIVAHTAARDGRSVPEMKHRIDMVARGLVEHVVETLHAGQPASRPTARISFNIDETDLLRGFK